jgi:hypothetical protein
VPLNSILRRPEGRYGGYHLSGLTISGLRR